ncbi:MAG: aminoacyl-tRNA hydrolase [Planctomycetales bacterium]
MKIIIGLGNPGRKYQDTRHNVGFLVVAEIARRCGVSVPKARFDAEVLEAVVDGEKLLLVSPLTYMNRSGQSARAAVDFYKLEPEDVLVACDDLNLPLGKIRLRAKGSAGGQKGLQDVIRHLNSDSTPRLRIGIGETPDNWDAADFVLSKFTNDEQSEIEQSVREAAQAAVVWATEGIEVSMNRYNGRE